MGTPQKSYKKVKVCEDEDTICESEVRWGQMTELLQSADDVRLMVRGEYTTIDPKEREVERHKQVLFLEHCHIAFAT